MSLVSAFVVGSVLAGGLVLLATLWLLLKLIGGALELAFGLVGAVLAALFGLFGAALGIAVALLLGSALLFAIGIVLLPLLLVVGLVVLLARSARPAHALGPPPPRILAAPR